MLLIHAKTNKLYGPDDMERRMPSATTNEPDARDPFEKDFGRIVHSAAFRRLQSKTQVIGTEAGDFHRTRLTHSMEVAQIARGIAIHLNARHPWFHEDFALDVSLLEAAALAHDLGHPPFGHRGEEALHECMAEYGGFEGNAQTFRILTRLEGDRRVGLNLTRALLLSVMKYPAVLDDLVNPEQYRREGKIHPPKASVYESDREAFEWVMKPFTEKEKDFFTRTESRSGHHRRTLNKTLECSVIEMADDIAYGTHDVEDAINLGLIGLNELKELVRPFGGREEYPELRRAWKELDGLRSEDGMIKYPLKKIFAALISVFITRLEVIGPVKGIASPRLQATVVLPDDLRRLLDGLKLLVLKKVIESQRVQTIAFKGTHIVKQLFSALMSEKKLLPENDRTLLEAAADERERARVVCDYIAGMTDSFAMKMYHRLFGHSRSFFDF